MRTIINLIVHGKGKAREAVPRHLQRFSEKPDFPFRGLPDLATGASLSSPEYTEYG